MTAVLPLPVVASLDQVRVSVPVTLSPQVPEVNRAAASGSAWRRCTVVLWPAVRTPASEMSRTLGLPVRRPCQRSGPSVAVMVRVAWPLAVRSAVVDETVSCGAVAFGANDGVAEGRAVRVIARGFWAVG